MNIETQLQFFAAASDPHFREMVGQLPDTHWARYDLSAVRLGWELRKIAENLHFVGCEQHEVDTHD